MIRDFLFRSYLGDGEKIIFVIHRHVFMQAKDFMKIMFFGLLIPAFLWWLFPPFGAVAGIWLGLGLIRFIYEFFDWYYDVWLVTNVSITEIVWQGFFEKSSARIEYHIIQGIGYEVKGFVRTIFNYGTITLDKFTGNSSVFDGAMNPKRKAELLTQAQDEFVKNKSFRDHHALQNLISDLLQQHVSEHGVPSAVERNS
ncbi:hypothetical protein CO046_05180 [Candidatus Peregrinibacteria bacterium CG_4_9_14_0_2_um_filter_53_11]|nr:MAG: hypothetical protein CO046_05180 [Candidatus Peregrinibacteria bacterium CG_4_9_14_0_2_um_filter_53_11]